MTATTWQFKLTICLAIILTISHGAKADTKVLNDFWINFEPDSAFRHDTISLENGKDLVIKGLYQEIFALPNDPDYHFRATIHYVADKNGYSAKTMLIKEEDVDILRFSPSTLKSFAG